MKIKSRLRINSIISLGVLILIMLVLSWSLLMRSRASRNMDLVAEMRKVAFERIVLRDDYLLNREARAQSQWQAKSETLRRLLQTASSKFTGREEQALLKEARVNFDSTLSLFSKFMEEHEKMGGNSSKGTGLSEADSSLVNQLFLKANALNGNISRLYESSLRSRTEARYREALVIFLSIFGGVVALGINSASINRILSQRITALNKGVEIIGAGDLDYRITTEGDDELSALALASNEMAERLGRSYTSITLLESEIERRKRVEDALHESEKRLSEAQKMAQLGYWSWDVKSGRVEWSEEVYKIFHLDPDKFTPNIDSILALSPWPQENERGGELIWRAMESHEMGDYEQRFLRPDGSSGYYYSTFQGRYDDAGDLISIVGTVLDITERKRREKEVEEKNAELERFTYTVSHDLKSPLVTIKTFLGYLEQDILDADENLVARDIGFMHGAADKMAQLLNELLEMSRVGRVVNPPEHVSFGEIVKDALDAVAGGIAERGVEVKVDDSAISLYGDRPRLMEIWQNLIENGIKYMGERESPLIEAGAETVGEETIFFVRDNGIGIDPRHKEKIFGLFEKLDLKSEGSGLGLALVKRIVAMYHGTIRVESDGPGKGACFRFTLPAAISGQWKGGKS